MFALLNADGSIVQIEAQEFAVAPPLAWVDIANVSPSPAVGWSYDGSKFTAPPAPPSPTLAQQAQNALFAGLSVTSTAHPAINGTYAVDGSVRATLALIGWYVEKNGALPSDPFEWVDISGTPHAFPDAATFDAFASAVARYATVLDLIAATNSGTLPDASVTIT